MSEWISVEDELPEEYKKVLIFKPKNAYTKVELIKWFTGDETEGITHWMNLPEPPHENT